MPRWPRPLGAPAEPGGDGRSYYILMGVPVGLIRLYEGLVEASEIAQQRSTVTGDTSGRAQSLAIDLLIQQVRTRVDSIAVATAELAQTRARAYVKSTAKRPPPPLGLGQRLGASIVSRPAAPIAGLRHGGGAVGVGDVLTLDAGSINPFTGSNRGYWRAQEDGSTHMVGRVIPGVFQPGEYPPDASRSPQDPLFEKRGAGLTRYWMKISKPIEARNFLKTGAGDAYEFRHVQLQAMEAFVVSELRFIGTGNHPSLTRVKNVIRRIR